MRKLLNHELYRPTLEQFAQQTKIPVVVVLDNIRSLQNVGSFFRTGDAFAIERLMLCGITATPPNRDIHKTALGAEMSVKWEYHPTTLECLEVLREEGYRLLCIEQVEGAAMLDEVEFDPSAKYALIFGNEVLGVDQAVVDASHGAIEIPQAGTKHSVNVSVAGGVVLWHLFWQFRTKA